MKGARTTGNISKATAENMAANLGLTFNRTAKVAPKTANIKAIKGGAITVNGSKTNYIVKADCGGYTVALNGNDLLWKPTKAAALKDLNRFI